MAIKVGDKIPEATLKCIGPDGVIDIKVEQLFSDKKIVLFSLIIDMECLMPFLNMEILSSLIK